LDARVNTGRVARPDIKVGTDDGLASVDINKLRFKNDVDTGLIVAEVRANILAVDKEWADLALWIEDCRRACVEYVGSIRLESEGSVDGALVILLKNRSSITLDSILFEVGIWLLC
jgi:hypothetical protein